MNKSFLHQVIYDISQKINSFEDVLIVLPNKRPQLFIHKILGEITSKPFIAPEIVTIDELFKNNSPLVSEDSLTIILKIFSIYKKISKSPEDFDQFYFWGEMIASDFDDIDKYLVDAVDLFKNISSFKQLEDVFQYLSDEQIAAIKQFWSGFDPDLKSKHQKMFLEIWQVLGEIYKTLKADLIKGGLAYDGMLYRDIIEQIDTYNICFDIKKIVFVGFNALNECEIELFKYFQKNNKALFYWDFDPFFIDDNQHEAGFFLRKYLKLFPNEIDVDNSKNEKNIKIYSSPGYVQQIKFVQQFLHTFKENNELSNSALVLADENLLIPVLYSLPESIESLNISMGYALKHSEVFNILEMFLDMHKRPSKKQFYLFLDNHYVKTVFSSEIVEISKCITESGSYYIEFDKLPKNRLISLLVFASVDATVFVSKALKFIEILSVEGKHIINAIDIELMVKVFTVLQKLADTIAENIEHFYSLSLLVSVIKKYISGISVAFTGEPLQGLQIVGMLETRLLDFKNVIVLSMNEGVFPKGKPAPSFIPYSLRTGFGLPTIKHQDAIFSYYFYRLLNRAENVSLFYSEQLSEFSKGEKSRLLSQLIYSPKFIVEEKNIQLKLYATSEPKIRVEKDLELQNKLKKLCAEKPVTPSSFSKYIECSLKFYFSYVEGLQVQEDQVELPGDVEFGRMYHECLQYLYEPYLDKACNENVLKQILSDSEIEKNVSKALQKELNIRGNIDGYNDVFYSILKKYIENSVKLDIEDSPFVLKGLEKKVLARLISQNGELQLGGYIDRIDVKNDMVRIIDYKTGREKNKIKSIEDLFSDNPLSRNNAILQVFMYAFILKMNGYDEHKIIPKLYYIRSQFVGKNELYINNVKLNSYAEVSEVFEKMLLEKLDEILDKTIPFSQTTDTNICTYCDYRKMCNK